MLSDLPTAIYTRLKLLLLIKSKAYSGLACLCMNVFSRHLYSVNNPLNSLYKVACMFDVCRYGARRWCGRALDRSFADKECLLVRVDMLTRASTDTPERL